MRKSFFSLFDSEGGVNREERSETRSKSRPCSENKPGVSVLSIAYAPRVGCQIKFQIQ